MILAAMVNLTHYDIFLAPELTQTVLPFLNDENELPKSWGEQVQESRNQDY